MKRLQDEIPPAYLIKYFKREADDYKAKLSQLVPYAKKLEEENKKLRKENESLNKQLSIWMKDATHNPAYLTLKRRFEEARHDVNQLCLRLAKYETN